MTLLCVTGLGSLVASCFEAAGVRFCDDTGEGVAPHLLFEDDGILPLFVRDASRMAAEIGLSISPFTVVPLNIALIGERVDIKGAQAAATTVLMLIEAARQRFGLPPELASWRDVAIDTSTINLTSELTTYFPGSSVGAAQANPAT